MRRTFDSLLNPGHRSVQFFFTENKPKKFKPLFAKKNAKIICNKLRYMGWLLGTNLA